MSRFPILLLLCLFSAFVIIAFEYYQAESVKGGYSDWSRWGNCSHECGEGVRLRTRLCDNPAPGVYGLGCSQLGHDRETSACFLKICPVDRKSGPWSEFAASMWQGRVEYGKAASVWWNLQGNPASTRSRSGLRWMLVRWHVLQFNTARSRICNDIACEWASVSKQTFKLKLTKKTVS